MASRPAAEKGQQAPRKSRVYWLFVWAFLTAAASIFYTNPIPLQSLRFIVFDGYQRLAPAPPPEGRPVQMVDVDEESLARLGQWPWPRTTMAQLTDAIGRAGARAIVFDIMFTEPDRTSPEQMLQWMSPPEATQLRSVIGGWATHDGAFAQALSRNPTVLAATLQNDDPQGDFPLKAGFVTAGDDPRYFVPGFPGFTANLPALTDAASGVGSINWTPERDQVMRRVPLLFRQGETLVPSLALEALRVAEGQSTIVVRASNAHGANAFGRRSGVNQVRVGDRAISTDAQSAVWIHFRRTTPGERIPAWRVIDGEIDASQFRDRIVLIGTSAPGLLDLRATPIEAAIPGVEVHRQIIEQMLDNHFLTRPDFAPAIEFLFALVSVLLLAFLSPRLSAGVGALIGVVTIAAILAAGLFAFLQFDYLFDPVFPSACAFMFEVGAAFYLYRQTEQQRTQIRRAFSQYVAPSVVRELTAHPERLALGGEVRDLTLLFTDVRNFTGISEGLSAEELTTFINRLLTPLTDIILESGGTIDKYMGDAIMAFWNAPMDDPEHARHACEAAQQMAAKMIDLNKEWRAEAQAAGRPYTEVAIGIGVNSGDCCVGNLGSYRRFDYSAIGDNVNITSRIEGLTKIYAMTLLVGEDTARRLPDLPFFEVDLVRVKGHTAPSRLFTLRSTIGCPEAEWDDLRAAHERFIASYRAGAWEDAAAQLEQLRARGVAGLTGLYAMYAARVAKLAELRPQDWDGVYALEEK